MPGSSESLRSSLSIFHHSAWNVSLLITSHVLLLNLVGEVIPRTNRVTESMTIHFYILANSWRLLQGSSWLQLEYGSIWMASVQNYPIYSNDMMRWFLFGSLMITWHHQILQSRRIEAVLIVPRIGQTRGSASSVKFFIRRNQSYFHLQNTYFSFTLFSSAFLGHRVGHPYLPNYHGLGAGMSTVTRRNLIWPMHNIVWFSTGRRRFNYSPELLVHRGLQRSFSCRINIDLVHPTEKISDNVQLDYSREGMWIHSKAVAEKYWFVNSNPL